MSCGALKGFTPRGWQGREQAWLPQGSSRPQGTPQENGAAEEQGSCAELCCPKHLMTTATVQSGHGVSTDGAALTASATCRTTLPFSAYVLGSASQEGHFAGHFAGARSLHASSRH